MNRRQFVSFLSSAAAAWPVAGRAQQRERMRRIGVLMPGAADDPEYAARNAAFLQGLGEFGWNVGRNVQIDYRWGAGNVERYRALAEELVVLSPDVILGNGTATVSALEKATRTVPIVFAAITDPVGSGLVASLARPGGNATGFAASELALGGKLLELLKELAPRVTRVAVLRDSAIASQIGFLGGIQSVAPSLGVESRPIDLRDAGDIERDLTAFAREPNGGLVAVASAQSFLHRRLIVSLAERYKLPAIYSGRIFVAGGGLASYSADTVQIYRQAAGYVDRILRGEKPGNLPVQQSTKIELVLNLKTAKALGLTVPPTLLTLADEVIE